jgi:hypothetical protein
MYSDPISSRISRQAAKRPRLHARTRAPAHRRSRQVARVRRQNPVDAAARQRIRDFIEQDFDLA